jgi:hypothetical protein
MSQVGDGTTTLEETATQAKAGLGVDGGSGKPPSQESRPPSIHDCGRTIRINPA